MGRQLSVTAYGLLVSLFNIISVFNIIIIFVY